MYTTQRGKEHGIESTAKGADFEISFVVGREKYSCKRSYKKRINTSNYTSVPSFYLLNAFISLTK